MTSARSSHRKPFAAFVLLLLCACVVFPDEWRPRHPLVLPPGAPDLGAMRLGREALRTHLAYVEKLLAERDWLAGRRLTLADFAAAAHISVLDYFGDIPWREIPAAKTWYMKLKSRPCFRPLLADRWPGLAPAAHYDDLDF